MPLHGSLILVEDDEDFAELLHHRFTRRGMLVTVCSDAQSAKAALAQGSFDVAMLDRCLNGLDGINLARQFKQADGAMQILMLSGYSDSDSIALALESGIDKYLTKPCPLSRLETAVAELIQRAKIRQIALRAEPHLESPLRRDSCRN